MLDIADLAGPKMHLAGNRVLVEATLARIGPPYVRELIDEEYARIGRYLRLLGCAAPAAREWDGGLLHEWSLEGGHRLRMYGYWLQQGGERSLRWMPVE